MGAKEKFDKSLNITKLNLLFSGIKIDREKYYFILEYIFNNWLFYINIIWVYVDVIGEITWIVEGIQQGKNLDEVMLMTPCATVCMLGTIKVAPLYLRRKILIEVVEKIRDIHPEVEETHEENDSAVTDEEKKSVSMERKISLEAMNHFDKIISFFYIMCLPVVIAFCLLPIVLMGYDYFSDGVTEVKFPFSVKYFFDPTGKYVWPLIYFHQVVSTLIISSNVFGADTLFYAACNFIQMHFRLLRVQMEHLIGKCWENEAEEEIHNKMKTLIKRHQLLAEVVSQMELLYSYSSLFNFISSSFLICLSGFIVTTTSDIRLLSCFAAFLFMSMSQISIFCYGGDLIMQSSKDISLAAYNSRWYLADEGLKKSVFIVLMRAQKPCKLTAANFADLNLSAFATVLRRSWSYFALLKTMYQ